MNTSAEIYCFKKRGSENEFLIQTCNGDLLFSKFDSLERLITDDDVVMYIDKIPENNPMDDIMDTVKLTITAEGVKDENN